MELSELTAYAEEKYNIREQHKWADFPGFSVLAEPATGKWVALLMRQWDYDLGEEIQRCDIKCGEEAMCQIRESFVSGPFRMKGKNWAGVKFGRDTQPEVVFRLFDFAVRAERSKGFTIVLEEDRQPQDGQGAAYHDTLLPGRTSSGQSAGTQGILGRSVASGQSAGTRDILRRGAASGQSAGMRGNPVRGADRAAQAKQGRLAQFVDAVRSYFRDAEEDTETSFPRQIHEMLRLFEYGDNSLAWKSRIFVRQAKFMEAYEDDAPWEGTFRRYFPVYHDLGVRQLRGYFTWRTRVRKGIYEPVCASFAYIYLYELLCGIGTGSPRESLGKMREFEERFLDAGSGDEGMRKNLRRWMLEYCVLHDIPAEEAQSLADPAMMQRDRSLLALKEPQIHTDQEIFTAVCVFDGEKLADSPVVKRDREQAERLFAAVWRTAAASPEEDPDVFTRLFGRQLTTAWHPLANAVYWEEKKQADREYELNGCRTYICRDGSWTERQYAALMFDRQRFRQLWHETDRQLRRFWKTGHYLHEKPEEAWAAPFAAAVIAQERAVQEAEAAARKKEQEEAAKPKITIDLSALEQIRLDAMVTRDSLLTEEEMGSEPEAAGVPVLVEETPVADTSSSEEERPMSDASSLEEETPAADAAALEKETSAAAGGGAPAPVGESDVSIPGLDSLHTRILLGLLRGEDVHPLMREHLLMPALAADTINEALFDEIGDTVLECTDDRITLVEDYREDLVRILQI